MMEGVDLDAFAVLQQPFQTVSPGEEAEDPGENPPPPGKEFVLSYICLEPKR